LAQRSVLDSVRKAVAQLHPEVVADSNHNAFVTVAMVFDANCRLLHQAVGRRAGRAFADTVIARLIPEAKAFSYSTSGFAALASLTADEDLRIRAYPEVDIGTPWLVWGVQGVRGTR